jgi:serine/threonine-protein phosphatase 2A regulatory subunit B'
MVNLFSTGTKKKKESVVDDQQGNSATLRKPTSLSKQAMAKEMDELPQLRDYPAAKREALFEQKLELCSHVFNFEDAASLKKEKEIKRQTLLELVDYVNTSAGQKIFTEASMPSIGNYELR